MTDSHQTIKIGPENLIYVYQQNHLIEIMKFLKENNIKMTQRIITDEWMKLNHNDLTPDLFRRQYVKNPIENLRKMGIIRNCTKSRKNVVFEFTELGWKIVNGEFSSDQIIGYWKETSPATINIKYKNEIQKYDIDEIKMLFHKIINEMSAYESVYVSQENVIFTSLCKLNFENDPLYHILIRNKSGFFPEFTTFLAMLELLKIRYSCWLNQKNKVGQIIHASLNNSFLIIGIDKNNPKEDVRVYYDNLADMIYYGLSQYLEYKNLEIYEREYLNPTLNWKENKENEIKESSELRWGANLIIKISNAMDTLPFRESCKKLISEITNREDEKLIKEFKNLIELKNEKNIVQEEIIKLLDLLTKRNYSEYE